MKSTITCLVKTSYDLVITSFAAMTLLVKFTLKSTDMPKHNSGYIPTKCNPKSKHTHMYTPQTARVPQEGVRRGGRYGARDRLPETELCHSYPCPCPSQFAEHCLYNKWVQYEVCITVNSGQGYGHEYHSSETLSRDSQLHGPEADAGTSRANVRVPQTRTAHHEYMALAKKTSVLREAMLLFVEPA